MATAKKLPSGSWRVNLYAGKDDTGKRMYKSFTAATRKEAEFLAAEYALTQREAAKPENLTVGQAIDKYIANKTSVLSPSTVRGYDQIRRCRCQSLMDTRLCDLTQDVLQRAVNDEARVTQPKTVRNVYALITAALRESYPDFAPRAKLPPKVAREITVPEDADIVRLMADARGKWMELAIVLGACLGMRRSEICALRPADVDYARATVSVKRAVVRDENNLWVVKAPKSYAGTRTIDGVAPEVLDLLRSWPPAADGTILGVNPAQISESFTRLRNRLGLTLRFHDLRHYNASIMLALGIPDKYAMKRLGQATQSMLKGVYQHVMRSKSEEVAKQVQTYTSAIMQHGMQHESH